MRRAGGGYQSSHPKKYECNAAEAHHDTFLPSSKCEGDENCCDGVPQLNRVSIPNSLLTGNFSWNFMILNLQERAPRQESPALQAFLTEFPRRARPAHPSPKINASVPRCDSACTIAIRDGGVAHRTQQRGQGISVGSNRSAFQHMRFVMGMRRCRQAANGHGSKSADEDSRHRPRPGHE